MNKVPTHVMPEPWSDRQVILAIALTLILVLGPVSYTHLTLPTTPYV